MSASARNSPSAGTSGGAVEGVVEQRGGADAVDAEDAFVVGEVAVGLEVPLALVGIHPVRIDRAMGALVASVAVVVELDLTVIVDGPSKQVEGGRGGLAQVDLDGRGVDPEHGGDLGDGARQRAIGIGAGQARQAAARGHDGQRLIRSHAQRSPEVVGEVHGARGHRRP